METKTLALLTSTDKAWQEFGHHLAQSLADMDEGEHLIIEEKKRTVYVQFAALGFSGMRVEAVSSTYCLPEVELSKEDLNTLRALGWNPPTYIPSKTIPTPKTGSCNYYLDVDFPVSSCGLAELTVQTLRTVYHTAHPRLLHYLAFGPLGNAYQIRFSNLGIERKDA